MATIAELRGQRADLLVKARKKYEDARAQGREVLNTEERAEFDKLVGEARNLETQIADIEKRDADIAQLDQWHADAQRVQERRGIPPAGDGGNRGERRKLHPAVERRFGGVEAMRPTFERRSSSEYRQTFESYLRGETSLAQMERRAHVLGTDASGGYLALPTDLLGDLLQSIDDVSGIRQLMTDVQVMDAKTVRIPTVSSRGDDADWTAETGSVTADTSLALDKVDLTPSLVTKLIRSSRTFVQRVGNGQAFLISQLGRLFGVTTEKAALTGSGSGRPLGIFVASSSGIPTSRDVVSTNTTSSPSYVGLVAAKYSVKQSYLRSPSAGWWCHPDFMVKVLGILDGDDRPIFVPGGVSPMAGGNAGRQDSLLGLPVYYSEFAPNTFSANQYVAVVGDMSFYYWADGMNYSVQVADQLYAASNEIGYFGRMEADGKPALAEAFARVKLAAS